MIYRGPGFLAVVEFSSSPTPYPLHQYTRPASATHRKTEKERQLTDGDGGGRRCARCRIIRPQEIWSSINHSILSGDHYWKAIQTERLSALPEWVAWDADWIRECPQVRIYPARSCKSPPEHWQVTNITVEVVAKSAPAIDLVRVCQ